MRSLVPGLLIGLVTVCILGAGACGGSTDTPAPSDASSDAPIRYETSPPDTSVPYTPLTKKCVAAPYTNPVTDPDGSFIEADAGDDDAGPTLNPPQLVSFGGPVLTAPQIIPITYPGDALADQIEDFVSSIGCTDYWRQTVSEYGIGQAQMPNTIRLTDPAPTSTTDAEISSFISKQITAKAPGFASPHADSIFAVYLPSGTSVELQGTTSCSNTQQSFLGYHSSFELAGRSVAYAVIARCNGDIIDDVTNTSSHEFIEASTDPSPQTNPAYLFVDTDHLGFGLLGGGEAGDLCENGRNAQFTPDGYPFAVQRTWSNSSILAGHDPCVPAEAGPYVAAMPEQPDTVPIQNVGFPSSRGVAIAVGASRTIDIHFHTDDPATTTWTVTATDVSRFTDGVSHLTLALDTNAATADGIAHLTITRNSKSPTYGAEPFSIRSTTTSKTNSSSWYGFVGDP